VHLGPIEVIFHVGCMAAMVLVSPGNAVKVRCPSWSLCSVPECAQLQPPLLIFVDQMYLCFLAPDALHTPKLHTCM
jgi:hypothetical protein